MWEHGCPWEEAGVLGRELSRVTNGSVPSVAPLCPGSSPGGEPLLTWGLEAPLDSRGTFWSGATRCRCPLQDLAEPALGYMVDFLSGGHLCGLFWVST